MSLLLGIDLGTTTARAVIFDLDGNEIASAYREVDVDYPKPAWAEVPPERWWQAISLVVREAVSSADGAQIAGIGLSGLMHAPVLLDPELRPLAPAMLWMDQRCADQAKAIGTATTVSAPKLRWVVENRPDLAERAGSFVLSKDFIRIQLTGIGGTETSDAGGTGMLDRERNVWDDAMVARTGWPPEKLPRLNRAGDQAGAVTAAAAEATGLGEGTPVAFGGSDVHCTRIAVGPTADGEVCLYMGTAAWMHFSARGWGGSTATTGAALRWARDILGGDREFATPGESYEALLEGVAEVEPGAEGLFCLPHLNGERGPKPDPLARGAFVGLTLRHRRPHLLRAVLEGTCYQIRRNFDERSPVPVRGGVVAGGVARSRLWMQTLVDVTNVPLRVPGNTEASVLGAAMLGGVAAGLFSLEEAQARMVRPGATYTPDPIRAERYGYLYRRYCKLDETLLAHYHEEASC